MDSTLNSDPSVARILNKARSAIWRARDGDAPDAASPWKSRTLSPVNVLIAVGSSLTMLVSVLTLVYLIYASVHMKGKGFLGGGAVAILSIHVVVALLVAAAVAVAASDRSVALSEAFRVVRKARLRDMTGA